MDSPRSFYSSSYISETMQSKNRHKSGCGQAVIELATDNCYPCSKSTVQELSLLQGKGRNYKKSPGILHLFN